MGIFTQTTNFAQISYLGSDTWLVPLGIVVTVTPAGAGVVSTFAGSTLLNHGDIEGAGVGVSFIGAGASANLIINATAGIIGGGQGILVNPASNTATSIVNFGSIDATLIGVNFSGHASGSRLDNRGSVFAATYGVQDQSLGSVANTIANSAAIEGGSYGVLINAPHGHVTQIVNSGVIRGGVVAIGELSGSVSLRNTGTLAGGILMQSASALDVASVVNSGHIIGAVTLGSGNDTFNGTGGTSGPIDGGLGGDTLTGGPGKDHFVFDTILSPSNIDHITNFRHSVDKIDLKHSIFSAGGAVGALAAARFFEGPAAHDASDRIIYNPANGFLTYDTNGNHAGGAQHFATLAAHLTLTSADFLLVA